MLVKLDRFRKAGKRLFKIFVFENNCICIKPYISRCCPFDGVPWTINMISYETEL